MDATHQKELEVFAEGVYGGMLELYKPPKEEKPYRNLVYAIFGIGRPEWTTLFEVVQGVLVSHDESESLGLKELKEFVRIEMVRVFKPFVQTEWPPGAIPLIHAALETLPERERQALEALFGIGDAPYVRPTAGESAQALGVSERFLFDSRRRGLERLSRGIFRAPLWVLSEQTERLRGFFVDPVLIYAEIAPQLGEAGREKYHPCLIQALLLPVEALPLKPQHWKAIQKTEIEYLFQAVIFRNPEGRRAVGQVVPQASLHALNEALGVYGLHMGMRLPKELVERLEAWVHSQEE